MSRPWVLDGGDPGLVDGTESMDVWRGPDALRDVVVRATSAERSQRHQSVREFVDEWHGTG